MKVEILKRLQDLHCMIERDNIQLSEIDTQFLFVEPVLMLTGFDVDDPRIVKRTSRNAYKDEFDVEVYGFEGNNKVLSIGIECKSLSSSEYNISKFNRGIGALTFDASMKKWKSKVGDGVGQLRGYCMNYKHFQRGITVPVLTNGISWVIFNPQSFVDEIHLCEHISDQDIEGQASIADSNRFIDEIINGLRGAESI